MFGQVTNNLHGQSLYNVKFPTAENLDKANQMMLQHFRQLQQWQDSLSRSMAAKNRENVERQETNVKVR